MDVNAFEAALRGKKRIPKETVDELFEQELREIFKEMKQYHSDTPEYHNCVEALNRLMDAEATYRKSISEGGIDINVLLPVLVKGGICLGAIMFWIALERNHPAPMRLANWTSNLIRF